MNNEMTTDNMSNEEVIETLKGIVFNGFDRTTRKERQALDLAIKALEERPQGDWIECTKSGMPLTEYGRMMGEKWYGFKCSRCKFIYKGNALVESPFCQKCGADMRKEGAE